MSSNAGSNLYVGGAVCEMCDVGPYMGGPYMGRMRMQMEWNNRYDFVIFLCACM